mgnify:CR=1 FL=1
MAPAALFPARTLHARNPRGVAQLSRKNDEPGQDLAEGRQGRLIGDVTGGEKQGRAFLMQVGERTLELDMIVRGPGDIARAAGARTDAGPSSRTETGAGA